MQYHIPSPFVFNAQKHHAGFLRNFISEAFRYGLIKAELLNFVQKIGNSMIDIYYGALSIDDVITEIRNQLVAEEHFEKEAFENFINKAPGAFVNINISDTSVWTLLIGNDHECYIHIHPARQSPHTLRVGALALKTALILKIYYSSRIESGDLVFMVNEVRQNFLDESPIKNISYTKNLMRVMKLI